MLIFIEILVSELQVKTSPLAGLHFSFHMKFDTWAQRSGPVVFSISTLRSLHGLGPE